MRRRPERWQPEVNCVFRHLGALDLQPCRKSKKKRFWANFKIISFKVLATLVVIIFYPILLIAPVPPDKFLPVKSYFFKVQQVDNLLVYIRKFIKSDFLLKFHTSSFFLLQLHTRS